MSSIFFQTFIFDDRFNPPQQGLHTFLDRSSLETISFCCSVLESLCCFTLLFKIPQRYSIRFKSSNIPCRCFRLLFFQVRVMQSFWSQLVSQYFDISSGMLGAICISPFALIQPHVLCASPSRICVHYGSPGQVHSTHAGLNNKFIWPKNMLPIFIRLLLMLFSKVLSCCCGLTSKQGFFLVAVHRVCHYCNVFHTVWAATKTLIPLCRVWSTCPPVFQS